MTVDDTSMINRDIDIVIVMFFLENHPTCCHQILQWDDSQNFQDLWLQCNRGSIFARIIEIVIMMFFPCFLFCCFAKVCVWVPWEDNSGETVLCPCCAVCSAGHCQGMSCSLCKSSEVKSILLNHYIIKTHVLNSTYIRLMYRVYFVNMMFISRQKSLRILISKICLHEN